MNSSGVITVYLFTINMLYDVEVMFIQLLNLLKIIHNNHKHMHTFSFDTIKL